MQDNKLYRPPAGSLLGDSSLVRTPQQTSFLRRFVITLLWAIPLFITVLFYFYPVSDWPGMALGSILLALVAALVAMFIPTRFKIVYVTSGILVALGIALLTASH